MGVTEIDQLVQNRSDLSADILHSAGYRVRSIDYWEQCWLYSLTAAGRKDLRYLSFTHFGCISLLLKELPSAVRVTCRGWDSCTSSDDSLSIILLSPTTCTEPRGHPRMEMAFLTSLSSLAVLLRNPEAPSQSPSVRTVYGGSRRCLS